MIPKPFIWKGWDGRWYVSRAGRKVTPFDTWRDAIAHVLGEH